MTVDKNLTHQAIRAQLVRILKNVEFKASDKQRQFLSFVVEETLEGRTSQIKGYTIAVAVYGRIETFDPQIDPIVRVEAGRLRRALEHYYLTAGSNDPLRIVIPKGTYIPDFHSAEVQRPESKTFIKESPDNTISGEPTIAVMPLINLTDDNEQDYFADGLTEEMTAEIARYQDIHVIASQSTMRFKGQTIDPKKIGHDPGYGMAYAMIGHLHADNYALGFREFDAPLEKALEFVQKGVALEPQNQFARDALTLVFFHLGDKEAFLKQVEETIDLNPNSPYVIGVAGWHMALFGEWHQGIALLEKGMKLNPYYPTWFHLATFMNHYRAAEYEMAYGEALKFNFPNLFWDPVIRAAALSQLGRIDDANSAIQQLLEIEPNFETQGRFLIRRYVKVERIADKVIEGLRKAGMENIN